MSKRVSADQAAPTSTAKSAKTRARWDEAGARPTGRIVRWQRLRALLPFVPVFLV